MSIIKTAVALTDPRFPHNVGAALRACSCWDIPRLLWSGKRVPHPDEWKDNEELNQYRLPREERMKGYKRVEIQRTDRFKDIILEGYTPVAIEVMENSENLFDFIHPENALYIFGPEDGSLEKSILQHCHRFVHIPTQFCLNLACAVNVVLADRAAKKYRSTGSLLTLQDNRGFGNINMTTNE